MFGIDPPIAYRWGGPLGIPRDWMPSVGLRRRPRLGRRLRRRRRGGGQPGRAYPRRPDPRTATASGPACRGWGTARGAGSRSRCAGSASTPRCAPRRCATGSTGVRDSRQATPNVHLRDGWLSQRYCTATRLRAVPPPASVRHSPLLTLRRIVGAVAGRHQPPAARGVAVAVILHRRLVQCGAAAGQRQAQAAVHVLDEPLVGSGDVVQHPPAREVGIAVVLHGGLVEPGAAAGHGQAPAICSRF